MHKTEQKSRRHGRAVGCVCVSEAQKMDTTRKRKTGHGRRCAVCWSCHIMEMKKKKKNLHEYSARTHTCSADGKFPCAIYATCTLLLSVFSQLQRYKICAYDRRKIHTTTKEWAQPFIRVKWMLSNEWVRCRHSNFDVKSSNWTSDLRL